MRTSSLPIDHVRLLGAAVADHGIELPLATPRISCGFPSPAEGHTEERLDLVRRLV